jgi:hypothetical protein
MKILITIWKIIRAIFMVIGIITSAVIAMELIFVGGFKNLFWCLKENHEGIRDIMVRNELENK